MKQTDLLVLAAVAVAVAVGGYYLWRRLSPRAVMVAAWSTPNGAAGVGPLPSNLPQPAAPPVPTVNPTTGATSGPATEAARGIRHF